MKSSRSKSAGQRVSNGSRNVVRIIAGRWRGRRIAFPDGDGLRPTPDRVRETVFNWLQPVIADARCLDLFAGSGVLGFESLSRGASHGVFVERERLVCEQLRATAATLKADSVKIECADALQWLQTPPRSAFDIVFLDPPYASDALSRACELLATRSWLAPGASIYLETPADAPLSFLPAAWTVVRSKRAGQVGYHLARVPAPGASTF
ncbi:MAG: 16S rRNA (guanine(966)-N(2))-methyltransferase RsmD [Steroidobacteraceae bacterium]